ncbi:unnamed protein product [Penicillium bialowiezense]
MPVSKRGTGRRHARGVPSHPLKTLLFSTLSLHLCYTTEKSPTTPLVRPPGTPNRRQHKRDREKARLARKADREAASTSTTAAMAALEARATELEGHLAIVVANTSGPAPGPNQRAPNKARREAKASTNLAQAASFAAQAAELKGYVAIVIAIAYGPAPGAHQQATAPARLREALASSKGPPGGHGFHHPRPIGGLQSPDFEAWPLARGAVGNRHSHPLEANPLVYRGPFLFTLFATSKKRFKGERALSMTSWKHHRDRAITRRHRKRLKEKLQVPPPPPPNWWLSKPVAKTRPLSPRDIWQLS